MDTHHQQSVSTGLRSFPEGSFGKGCQQNHWVIHWLLEGAAVFQHPDGEFLYDSGFLLVKPGVYCSWQVLSSINDTNIPNYWKIVWFTLPSTPRMEKAFAQPEIRNGYIRLDVSDPELRHKINQTLLRANTFAASDVPQASELALTAIEEALLWWEIGQESSVSVDPRVGAALKFLRRHLYKRIKISDVVRHCGLSRPRLLSLFRQQVGEPMMTSFERMRMRQADKILRAGFISVKEVADSFGYTDVKYFSRRFKKIMGFSPKRHLFKSCPVYTPIPKDTSK